MPSMYGPWLPYGDRPVLSVDRVGDVVADAVKQRGFFVIAGRAKRGRSVRGRQAV